MKYLKQGIALIVCIAILCTQFIFFSASATAPNGIFAGMGEYTTSLLSDPSTMTPPEEFGSISANGKVWVDKSVVANKDKFEITLSALAQEYISEDTSATANSTAADVVMILDMSGSMDTNLTLDGETMTRTKAMVKAVNEAVDIILSANENNRVLIYTYQGSGSDGRTPLVQEFLPLGHYTNENWTSEEIWSGNGGKYFNYLTSDAIQTARNLKKDGGTFSQKSIATDNGTLTQNGIAKGIGSLINSISSETKTVERKPYVLLFTDGAPGCAHTTWYNIPSGKCNLSHSNSGTAQITALTVLTAALMKNKLNEAYTIYNGKTADAEWFNIGLGVSDNLCGTLFLDPENIATNTSTMGDSIRNNINTYTTGNYSDYASYSTNYVYTEHSYLVNTGNALKEAFKELADKVEAETKIITFPIVSTQGATGDLVFTDELGDGLGVSDITLYANATTPILATEKSNNVYTFDGYDMTVELSTNAQNRKVLTWHIPADEIAIFSFLNRQDPTDGRYNTAEPIRLCYNAYVLAPQNYNGETIYSNNNATAQFYIAKDNPYYHNADGSTKTDAFKSVAKENNVTGTNENSISFVTNNTENIGVTVNLGNNGILKPVMQLQKEADSEFVEPSTEAGFTLIIKNVGTEILNDVVVEDTLPADLTYKLGSALGIEPTVNGQTLSFLVPKIDAGQTLTISYKATLIDDAANFKVLTNTAAISEIHTIEVFNPVEATSSITVKHFYKVNYSWTGNIPSKVELPTDVGRYATGTNYTVDQQFTAETKIENKDAYNNVTERWTFSGWSDPNAGIMGDRDVTIPGVWSYESFTIPAHEVLYEWTGDIPQGVVIPNDSNTYVNNQPYTVDTEYTSATAIYEYDTYNNVKGIYTFSGWADPNNAVMGDEDVTVRGVWRYESVTVEDHTVIYVWKGDIPSGENLPLDENRYVNNQPYSVDATYNSTTTRNDYDIYGNLCGYWSFSGWTDPNNGIMGNNDVTIEGVWSYTTVPVPDYKVTYVWSGEIPSGQTLPTDENRYVTNQPYSVDTTYNGTTMIDDRDTYGNLCGYWSFSGWTDQNNGVMGNSDVTIEGVWSYTTVPVPDYKVTYVWSGEIPSGQTLPTDENRYVTNQPYSVDTNYEHPHTIYNHDKYNNICGYWSFSGWDDTNHGIMANHDITIEGVWTYTEMPVAQYKVIYTWSGDIPSGQIIPTDSNRYVLNQPYNADKIYTSTTKINDYDKYGNICGGWSFSGWTDPNNGIMGNADIIISGVWIYNSVAVNDFGVIYNWSGEIPAGVDLPTDSNRYITNQPYTVDDTYTDKTVINEYDENNDICGRYTFSGWSDPNYGIMGNSDVTVVGIWDYEQIEKPEFVTPPEDTHSDIALLGDNSNIKIIMILCAVSLVILIILSLSRKR